MSNIPPEVKADLENRFRHHPPTGEKVDKHYQLREKSLELAELIAELCPESRERSLSFTNLEQALFWANASIARQQEVPT